MGQIKLSINKYFGHAVWYEYTSANKMCLNSVLYFSNTKKKDIEFYHCNIHFYLYNISQTEV